MRSSNTYRQLASLTRLIMALLVMALLAVGFCPLLQAATLSGTVIKVHDGDTITLLAGKQRYKIRLLGIDAPEQDQTFGAHAKKQLSQLLMGKWVSVNWQHRDTYQRIVGQIWMADPICKTQSCALKMDANLQQISTGSAWWYRYYANQQHPADAALYQQAEKQARLNRLGLWSQTNPTPPWQWRRNR